MQDYSIFTTEEIKTALSSLEEMRAYHKKALLMSLTESDVRYHAEKLEQHISKIKTLTDYLNK